MSCNELFRFTEIKGGVCLEKYLQRQNSAIEEVAVPSEHNGLRVLEIGDSAFYKAYHLRRVTIPEGVVRIGWEAFSNMFELEEINIPGSVAEIGEGAFAYCLLLKNIALPEGVRRIGKYAFNTCAYLSEVVLPKSLELLESDAFYDCARLRCVTFLNPNTRIGGSMFRNCTALCAENILMGLLCSVDLTAPLPARLYRDIPDELPVFGQTEYTETILRRDIFELAVRNGCFREAECRELSRLFALAIECSRGELIRTAAEGGLLSDAGTVGELIDRAAAHGLTELTAWLLDFKNSTFGFDGREEYEL